MQRTAAESRLYLFLRNQAAPHEKIDANHLAMPLPQRRWLHHTSPGWVLDATFFLTLCCQPKGENHLCTPAVSNVIFSGIGHYQKQLRWHVSLWLLMPDHLHAIVSVPRSEDLQKTIASFKHFVSHETGICWQRGFFDHRLRNDESFEEKAHYIRMNPVRRGLVCRPEDWPYAR